MFFNNFSCKLGSSNTSKTQANENILEKDLEVVTGARKKLSTVRKESQVTHLLVQVDTDAVVPSLLLRLLVVETSVTRNVQSWGREEPA